MSKSAMESNIYWKIIRVEKKTDLWVVYDGSVPIVEYQMWLVSVYRQKSMRCISQLIPFTQIFNIYNNIPQFISINLW